MSVNDMLQWGAIIVILVGVAVVIVLRVAGLTRWLRRHADDDNWPACGGGCPGCHKSDSCHWRHKGRQ